MTKTQVTTLVTLMTGPQGIEKLAVSIRQKSSSSYKVLETKCNIRELVNTQRIVLLGYNTLQSVIV